MSSHRNGASRSPEDDEEEEEAFLRWSAAAEEAGEYQAPPDGDLRGAELDARLDARVEPGVLRVRAPSAGSHACMHAISPTCLPPCRSAVRCAVVWKGCEWCQCQYRTVRCSGGKRKVWCGAGRGGARAAGALQPPQRRTAHLGGAGHRRGRAGARGLRAAPLGPPPTPACALYSMYLASWDPLWPLQTLGSWGALLPCRPLARGVLSCACMALAHQCYQQWLHHLEAM